MTIDDLYRVISNSEQLRIYEVGAKIYEGPAYFIPAYLMSATIHSIASRGIQLEVTINKDCIDRPEPHTTGAFNNIIKGGQTWQSEKLDQEP